MQLSSEPESVDVARLLKKGIKAGIAEGLVREEAKRGMMRGANQGLYVDGRIVGVCHRATMARMIGAEPPRDDSWVTKHIMFDSGHANEDSWVANLARAWDGPILREEDIPVSWQVTRLSDGSTVEGSGRPDIVLCKYKPRLSGVVAQAVAATLKMVEALPGLGRLVDAHLTTRVTALVAKHLDAYIPVQALELKQVSSINTAADVMFAGGKPKLTAALQAARYARCLGVPYQIWYTLPFVCPVPNWSFLRGKFPAKGEPGSEYIDYGYDGTPSKVQPHAVGYELAWDAGRLHYRRVGTQGWVQTVITEEGLDDYWSFTVDRFDTKNLGPRVEMMDIHGAPEKWGSKTMCDYCEHKPVCDSAENNFDEWVAAMEALVPAGAGSTSAGSAGEET